MKKILSIFLALTLIIGLIPTAFASDTASEATSVTYKFYDKILDGHSDVTEELEDKDGLPKKYTSYPSVSSDSDRMWAYLGTTISKSASSSGFLTLPTSLPYLGTAAANQNEWIAFKVKVPETAKYALSGKAYMYRSSSKKMEIYLAPLSGELETLLEPSNSATYGNCANTDDDENFERSNQKFFSDSAFRILDDFKLGNVSIYIAKNATNEKTVQPFDASELNELSLTEGEYVLLLNNGSETAGTLSISEITLTEQVTEDTWGSTEPEETTLDTAVFTATTNIPDVAEVTVDDKVGNLQISSGEAGRTVSVSAPDMTEKGYTFIGWQRGVAKEGGETYAEADGTSKLIDLAQTDKITVYTNTFLTAVYEKNEPETSNDPQIKFWNQDKSYLGTIAKSKITGELPKMTLIGHSFLGWYTAPEDKLTDVNAITADTNVVAQYNAKSALDSSDENDIITVNGVARTEKNYGEEVICPADGNVTHWLRDGKIVSYDKEYTHYIWDATVISSSYAPVEKKPLVVLENTTIDGASMIEYDGAGKQIVEVGILFGAAGTTPIVGSAFDKYVSQRNGNHGQLAAKPIDESYTVARGYMIYIDNGNTYVIYSE